MNLRHSLLLQIITAAFTSDKVAPFIKEVDYKESFPTPIKSEKLQKTLMFNAEEKRIKRMKRNKKNAVV